MSYLKENRGISKDGLSRIAKALTSGVDYRFELLEKVSEHLDDVTILHELVQGMSDDEAKFQFEEIMRYYDLGSVASKKRSRRVNDEDW